MAEREPEREAEPEVRHTRHYFSAEVRGDPSVDDLVLCTFEDTRTDRALARFGKVISITTNSAGDADEDVFQIEIDDVIRNAGIPRRCVACLPAFSRMRRRAVIRGRAARARDVVVVATNATGSVALGLNTSAIVSSAAAPDDADPHKRCHNHGYMCGVVECRHGRSCGNDKWPRGDWTGDRARGDWTGDRVYVHVWRRHGDHLRFSDADGQCYQLRCQACD
mmetsp:Transcript_25292/g.62620  ORF Transcript_25292/g.62620 Transcript_25292/m.62620 type:complete len:222 (-) Transcript_25292:1113-1778(-)